MPEDLTIAAVDDEALAVAVAAFRGLQRGAGIGDWSGFLDLLADDVRLIIPLPVSAGLTGLEGLNVGIEKARKMFRSHHEQRDGSVRLDCKRIAANGSLIVMEGRIEGDLADGPMASGLVFIFEVADGRIASMYEYAITSDDTLEGSPWKDLSFGREAFSAPAIPADESLFA
ncbi:MAG TPA: nuclear transport factor 2 family protein [Solirubrobacteraceae bacterium]|nr:nuclear transport factor 2 family protein [Solirubrobacteraceae bacterium]